MITTANPRSVAGKIVSTHNRHACHACQRPVDSGVFALSMSGSDARWYPDAETAQRQSAGPRYLVPVLDTEIELDDAIAIMERQREELENLIEHLHSQREERRIAREMREDSSGFRAGAFPCADCGYPKHRPADECDRCGDNPVPLGISDHDYNRGYGYRD